MSGAYDAWCSAIWRTQLTRDLVLSLSNRERLLAGWEFLERFPTREVLLISGNRPAANELARGLSRTRAGTFGLHRFTLVQFAAEITAGKRAESTSSILGGVALEALAARAVQRSKEARRLVWFDRVAKTPGFLGALVSTITELRLNGIPPAKLRDIGRSGNDLAVLLTEFESLLFEEKVSDLASVLQVAETLVRESRFRFSGMPMVWLDLTPDSILEQQLLRGLADQTVPVLATAHQRDEDSAASLHDILGVAPRIVEARAASGSLDRLRSFLFSTAAPAVGNMDGSVRFVSAADESRECVEIARQIVQLARSGIAFDRITVALRNPETYQPLLEDAFRRAGIPAFYTHGTRRPHPAGRALLSLLACAAEGLLRHDSRNTSPSGRFPRGMRPEGRHRDHTGGFLHRGTRIYPRNSASISQGICTRLPCAFGRKLSILERIPTIT
jgi:ATP-dependent helicase/nuclease subunit B